MEGNISRDLKKWRERKELTQEQLAEKVGVRRETVGHWENHGKQKKWPKRSNCLKLSNILGVKVTPKGIIEDHIINMEDNKEDKTSHKREADPVNSNEVSIPIPMPVWNRLERNFDHFERNSEMSQKERDKLLDIINNLTRNGVQSHK